MATIREVILPHHLKEDGTWNVKIRVTHKRQTSYIDTQHYIGSKQIRKDFTIKDTFILKLLNPVLDDYRTKVSDMGSRIGFYNAKSLAVYLSTGGLKKPEDINVIEFGRTRIEELRALKRDGSAANMVTVVNSLQDYFKSDFVAITEIRATMLKEYEKYLQSPRTLVRFDQFNKSYSRIVKGLADNGLHNHMRDVRILFNDIVEFYNDEDMGVTVIKHYPFKKYKLVEVTHSEKKKLNAKQILQIRDCLLKPGTRMEQARDLFMLSFYLCGMNAVDLWKLCNDEYELTRIDYKRSKTTGRRKDKAFISINIPVVARELFLKYVGTLSNKYSTHITLDQALSVGMREIGKKLKIADLEFYDARHAFGDLARNECRFSMDDVGLALNHKDQTNAVTDTYVSKSWKIIDEVQAGVLLLLIKRSIRKKSPIIEDVAA
jgi:integrase